MNRRSLLGIIGFSPIIVALPPARPSSDVGTPVLGRMKLDFRRREWSEFEGTDRFVLITLSQPGLSDIGLPV